MSKHRLFRFKMFQVDHSKTTMKVGTDGVLLGAWLNIHQAQTILDIGTGCGVIALMMAQRSAATTKIDAVEIEKVDAAQAVENICNSPWPDKVDVHCLPIQNFRPATKYDLIVSNPPFFHDSYQPPDVRRRQSRHGDTLGHRDLIDGVCRLLDETGTFNIILPPVEAQQFVSLAKENRLHLTRRSFFKTRANKPPERWLMEFSQRSGTIYEDEVLLYSSGDEWSEQYRTLTQDFYLRA